MSFIYLLIKVYPFFGISLLIVCLDLTKNFRRKASKLWILTLMLTGFFGLTSLLWLVFRGDQNADRWNESVQLWIDPSAKLPKR